MVQPLAVGTILNNQYRVVRLVGGGGTSWVYQAEELPPGSGKLWAVKELRCQTRDQEEQATAYRRFEKQARLLCDLVHVNIPRYTGFFKEDGSAYLVMEFVCGQSLEKKLIAANAPLSETDVLNWAIQLCDGLHYLHTRQPPIIFGDLRPSNVMVSDAGLVKLIDFGVSRTYAIGRRRGGIRLDTEAVGAPEQWGKGQLDARSDIYTLGAMMYHLLANVAPTAAFLPSEPQPICGLNRTLSAKTIAIVERAMARDQSDRFQSALEMHEALVAALSDYSSPLLCRYDVEDITLTCRLNRDPLPTITSQQLLFLLVQLEWRAVSTRTRAPLNLCLVLDKSGSMAEAKLQDMCEAAKLILDSLELQDTISIVAFSDQDYLVAESQTVAGKLELKKRLDGICEGGGTLLSCGMNRAMRELQRSRVPGQQRGMLLFTDGHTIGDREVCRELSREAQRSNISVNAFGLGSDWNDDLLGDVAGVGGGRALFLDSPDKMLHLFRRVADLSEDAVVDNARMVLRLASGVVPRQVWRILPRSPTWGIARCPIEISRYPWVICRRGSSLAGWWNYSSLPGRQEPIALHRLSSAMRCLSRTLLARRSKLTFYSSSLPMLAKQSNTMPK